MVMQREFVRRSLVLTIALACMNAFSTPSAGHQQGGETNEALVASLPCGSSAGVRFNLEPRTDPQPQNGTAVDFLPGAGADGGDLIVGAANDMRLLTSGQSTAPDFRGVPGLSSQTGFYVHSGSSASPCAANKEGGLPPLFNPASGNRLVGVGYPAVAAYPAGQSVYLADTRVGEGEASDSAVGLFRTTAAILTDSTVCPNGTLSESQSRQCWPQQRLVNLGSTFTQFNSNPILAIDERAPGSATGAGDIYIAGTERGSRPEDPEGFHSSIFIAACTNDLSACSPGVTISGTDLADLAHVAVRPDGGVTATYTVVTGGLTPTPTTAEIKYVTCQPGGAPASVTCSPASGIAVEAQAIPLSTFDPQGPLFSNKFVLNTFPRHAHRQDANGTETYVVWDRCKVSTAIPYQGLVFVGRCVDVDIVMAASNDNGQSWQIADLDASAQDQFQPWVAVDRTTNVIQVGYYTTAADAVFQHRAQVALRQIPQGGSTPDLPTALKIIAAAPLEPNGDPVLQGMFIGYYLGVAARTSPSGTRVYVHYTHTSVPGIYNGVRDPEQNNHLSRVDF
jgi:hypothetical protein